METKIFLWFHNSKNRFRWKWRVALFQNCYLTLSLVKYSWNFEFCWFAWHFQLFCECCWLIRAWMCKYLRNLIKMRNENYWIKFTALKWAKTVILLWWKRKLMKISRKLFKILRILQTESIETLPYLGCLKQQLDEQLNPWLKDQ